MDGESQEAGVIFLVGAVLVLRHGSSSGQDEAGTRAQPSFWRVTLASFAIIFAAEFGDVTQIVTANLAVKYHSPVSVLAGSLLALWAVAALAILGARACSRSYP